MFSPLKKVPWNLQELTKKSKFQKYAVPAWYLHFLGEGLLLEEFRIPETYFNHNFSEQQMGFK